MPLQMDTPHLENVYVTEEEVINSHSRRSGVSFAAEKRQRIYGCGLIQELGIFLRLPQIAIATGQTLFHRFYFVQSITNYCVENMAMVCIFLASKLEECVRNPRAVISVFYTLKKRREMTKKNQTGDIQPIDIGSSLFYEIKRNLLDGEKTLLQSLGFYTYVEHPHKFLINYFKILLLEKESMLVQTAWNYTNDSARTIACVRFRPEAIASACIYMAARMLQVPLPEEPHPWWALFDTTLEEMDQVCQMITELYTISPT